MLSDQNVELVQRFIRLPMQQRRVFFERLQAKGMNLSQFPIPVVRHAFEAVPLSYAQERLWFLWRLDPLSPAYHIRTALSLDGELDGAALQASLDALVARHEGLRTRFVEDNGQVFAQVDAKAKISIEQQPWNGSDTELDAFVGQWARQPFELDQGQLLRGLLLRRSACEHVLVLVQHHIISDAASMQVMVQEWLSLYAAHLAGQVPALAALPIQYGDYAIWQRCWMEAGERERQLKYWRERLGMDPGPLQLPLDHPRPLRASHRGERVKVRLPAALGQGLQQLAREQGASVFMVLLASFQALLQRYSGQDQVRVGVPIANRHRQETQGLIGFFVNTQVLQAQLTPQMSFLDLLEQVRASVAEAQSHQDLPFEQLVEALQPQRSAGHSPLFQVSYNHQGRQGPSLALPGLSLTPLELTSETVKFDLTLETQEQAQGLSASLLYATDLFQRATIERLASDWAGLLHGLWANPKAALCELPLQPVQPPQRLEARQAAPQVHRLIEAQVDRDPEALALVAQGRRLSYGQLEQQANHWAQRLLVEGLQAEERVAVIASRSVALAVGVLAVLKAGGAYVPLDPQENPERLAFRLNDAGVRRALVEPGFDGPLPDGVGRLELREVERPSAKRPYVVVAAEQLAYVIYTSGTTGLPKGVGVSHGALGNYVQGVSARLPLAGMASLAMVSTPAADLGHTVFFGALCAGKALHLVAAETAVDALRFAEYLDREQIDGLKIVPSHLESLVNAQGQQPVLPRRCVILGGESASEALLGTLARVAPRLTVINHYGPTETTVGVLTAELAAGQPVLLGRALAGSHVQVASPWLLAMPAGAQGELYIGGAAWQGVT
ncbi:condensation domain-containing protein [Pseudomonas putida]|nr:condensation domain-containing protein [Pseudomonas putida]